MLNKKNLSVFEVKMAKTGKWKQLKQSKLQAFFTFFVAK
jgi:hypothetical protein